MIGGTGRRLEHLGERLLAHGPQVLGGLAGLARALTDLGEEGVAGLGARLAGERLVEPAPGLGQSVVQQGEVAETDGYAVGHRPVAGGLVVDRLGLGEAGGGEELVRTLQRPIGRGQCGTPRLR